MPLDMNICVDVCWVREGCVGSVLCCVVCVLSCVFVVFYCPILLSVWCKFLSNCHYNIVVESSPLAKKIILWPSYFHIYFFFIMKVICVRTWSVRTWPMRTWPVWPWSVLTLVRADPGPC